MKKFTFYHIVWASLLTMLFSCTKTVNDRIPEDPAPEVTSYAVSYDEAVAKVNSLLDIIDVRTRGRSARRTIGDWYAWGGSAETRSDDPDGEEEPLLYVFNFENDEGFAIVSGDKRTVPVYAITESGSLHAGQEIDNPGFAIFMAGLQGGGYNPFEPPIDEGPPPGVLIRETYSYGPWTDAASYGSIIPSRWGQESPYNNLCPNVDGKTAWAGCAVIAVAQIMYHHGYPNSYSDYSFDWDQMRIHTGMPYYLFDLSDYPPAHPMIARLVQQLGTSANLNMTYHSGPNEGSSASYKDVPRTFSNFGYSNGGAIKDYNYSDLLSSVAAGKPVYVRGDSKRTPATFLGIHWGDYNYSGGHAWVVDAVLRRQREVKVYWNAAYAYSTYEYENLIHCNWGWHGKDDGYFYSGVFDSPNKVKTKSSEEGTEEGTENYFQYNLKMITGISR